MNSDLDVNYEGLTIWHGFQLDLVTFISGINSVMYVTVRGVVFAEGRQT